MRGALNDSFDRLIRLRLHEITLGFTVPLCNRYQHAGVTNFAMQAGTPGARGLLDNFAGANPGVGVFLGGLLGGAVAGGLGYAAVPASCALLCVAWLAATVRVPGEVLTRPARQRG